jgi:protoheme IX farnesyltransferase
VKAHAAAQPRVLSRLGDVVALAKPRITFMVLCTTACGMWLAPGPSGGAHAALALVGVALVVAGANALNMYLERDVDALMARTRNRPLPAGRLTPEVALTFGLTSGAAAVLLLTFAVNPLTGFLAATSLVLYVLAYTPLKRRTTAALLIGAVPGAMPPLLGWTAATGSLDAPGIALFLVLFVWQLPHFIAISLFRADDYARAGLKVVPVERGVLGAKLRIALYSAMQLLVSLYLARLGVAGTAYTVAATALGAAMLGLALAGLSPRAGDRWARVYFAATLVYLPALLGALALARA